MISPHVAAVRNTKNAACWKIKKKNKLSLKVKYLTCNKQVRYLYIVLDFLYNVTFKNTVIWQKIFCMIKFTHMLNRWFGEVTFYKVYRKQLVDVKLQQSIGEMAQRVIFGNL